MKKINASPSIASNSTIAFFASDVERTVRAILASTRALDLAAGRITPAAIFLANAVKMQAALDPEAKRFREGGELDTDRYQAELKKPPNERQVWVNSYYDMAGIIQGVLEDVEQTYLRADDAPPKNLTKLAANPHFVAEVYKAIMEWILTV